MTKQAMQNQKYVTTNIRLPEDLYLELKREAAMRRMSLGAVIRERLHRRLAKT